MQHQQSLALVLNLKTYHVDSQRITWELSPPLEWQKIYGFKASPTTRHQGILQAAQAQGNNWMHLTLWNLIWSLDWKFMREKQW